MPRIVIDDLEDPRLIPYRHLKRTNLTRSGERFIVEGAKLVDRLLESRFTVESILISDRRESELTGAYNSSLTRYVVRHALMDRVVGFDYHLGILACGLRTRWPAVDELVRGSGKTTTVVICPRLTNPENLGAIVRIADVFGLAAILAGPSCPDPLSRRVLRVSMGTALRMPVVVCPDLAGVAARLVNDWSFEMVASVVDPDAEPLTGFRRSSRMALLLGNEAEGLEPDWVRRCQRRLTIPMRAGAESLNVAVAAGIMLHHLTNGGDFEP